MKKYTIQEIEQIYDLELDKAISTIKKQKAKMVLLQFPEGLKPYSTIISKEIEEQGKCSTIIWIDTCFGACDLPLGTERLGIDLIIQFGHSKWNYSKAKDIQVI
ncbi:hypothetical protein GOV14_04300 [Candidatus Pacearchaeota archaeon]|nr:hypothetical protein [Candidatus Pacearchaeota archaeon]